MNRIRACVLLLLLLIPSAGVAGGGVAPAGDPGLERALDRLEATALPALASRDVQSTDGDVRGPLQSFARPSAPAAAPAVTATGRPTACDVAPARTRVRTPDLHANPPPTVS